MQQLGNLIVTDLHNKQYVLCGYNEFLNNLNGKVITDITEAYN